MSYGISNFGDIPNSLIGGDSSNQAIAAVSGVRIGGQTNKATLYLFSPKHMPNQVRRSHLYNFTDEYLHDVRNFVNKANNPLGQPAYSNPALLDSRAAPNAVQMSLNGSEMNCNAFGAMWAFLLVIDGGELMNNQSSLYQVTFDGSKKRYLYSGYCSDEPYNPTSHGGLTPTINPNCVLFITHQTALANTMANYGNQPMPDNMQVIANTDEFNPQFILPLMTQPMGQEQVFLNKPSAIVNAITDDAYSDLHGNVSLAINTTDAQLLPSVATVDHIQAELNGARKHAANINFAAQNAAMHTIGCAEEPSVHFSDGSEVMRGNMYEGLKQCESNFLVSPLGQRGIISIGELESMFPDIEATVCTAPYQSEWDVANPLAPNAVNMFSSLLATSIPPIMVNHKLAEISFRYTSYVPELVQMGAMDRSHYEVYTAASFIPESDERLRFNITRFMEELKTQVFPALLNAGGHFDVQVYCSSAYSVLIKLHFMDDGVGGLHNGLYETTNSLGGAISPLLSPLDVFNHNATQIATLLNAVNPQSQMRSAFPDFASSINM